MADLRIKMAATAAHKPTQHVGIGQQDAQLEKIIRECGGRAYFEKLTPSEKSTAMGYAGSDSIKDAEALRIFGKNSDSQAAQRLADSDPAAYRRLRAVAKSRNLFGK